MNLLMDDWITIRRRSGKVEKIAPVRLTANADDPAVEILVPRADFRGALYQFLIGLLQTAFAPRNTRQWQELWNAPSETVLCKVLSPFVEAFEFDTDGLAFMQDFDPLLRESVAMEIAALLIDAPGSKTVSDNKDHFVHRGGVRQVCYSCAATALFTLQINAPSGGAGHRFSVRGGGPLTTLLAYEKPYANLWHKIWINVLPQNILKRKLKYSGDPRASVGTVFPWMAPTRTSEPGSGQDTTPETAHPLQAYWSMPRRIRLDFSGVEAGVCDLCGESAENLVRRYRTKNYGVNYTGAWMHPLSPYNYGSREENPPLAVKGQRGGVGYRHWLGFTLGTAEKMPDASIAVRHFNRHILPEHEQEVQLWCFGYDLDNMKARCWHDCMLPVYSFADGERRRAFSEVVARLLAVAKDAAYQLNKSVKAARFKWPDDVDAGPAVPRSFWEASQALFYRLLEKAVHSDPFSAKAVAPIYKEWLKEVRRIAVELFDDWVLAAPIKKMNMRRVIEARVDLLKWLVKGEAAKSLWQFVHECNKEVA